MRRFQKLRAVIDAMIFLERRLGGAMSIRTTCESGAEYFTGAAATASITDGPNLPPKFKPPSVPIRYTRRLIDSIAREIPSRRAVATPLKCARDALLDGTEPVLIKLVRRRPRSSGVSGSNGMKLEDRCARLSLSPFVGPRTPLDRNKERRHTSACSTKAAYATASSGTRRCPQSLNRETERLD